MTRAAGFLLATIFLAIKPTGIGAELVLDVGPLDATCVVFLKNQETGRSIRKIRNRGETITISNLRAGAYTASLSLVRGVLTVKPEITDKFEIMVGPGANAIKLHLSHVAVELRIDSIESVSKLLGREQLLYSVIDRYKGDGGEVAFSQYPAMRRGENKNEFVTTLIAAKPGKYRIRFLDPDKFLPIDSFSVTFILSDEFLRSKAESREIMFNGTGVRTVFALPYVIEMHEVKQIVPNLQNGKR